jgi:hypothetical protein
MAHSVRIWQSLRLPGSASSIVSSNQPMTPRIEPTVRKVAATDLEVGVICADRDGNRVRIDRVDRETQTLSYHFLNDELRVQEGIQERSIEQFVAEGWYTSAAGKPL